MEKDPNGLDPKQPGAKLDAGKSPVYQGVLRYFPNAIQAVADVSAFGAKKYSWGGWRTVPEGRQRYADAMVRHATATPFGIDKESRLLHAAHAAWCALAVLEFELSELTALELAKNHVDADLGATYTEDACGKDRG